MRIINKSKNPTTIIFWYKNRKQKKYFNKNGNYLTRRVFDFILYNNANYFSKVRMHFDRGFSVFSRFMFQTFLKLVEIFYISFSSQFVYLRNG